jgi:hypothetical protein
MSLKLEKNQRCHFEISQAEKTQCRDDLLKSQHDAEISAFAQNSYEAW